MNLTVSYCIVCEEVRPEPLGKATILGFYGVLPRVDVRFARPAPAAARMYFLFGLHGDECELDATLNIINPGGDILVSIPGVHITIGDPTTSTAWGLGFMPLAFPEFGNHKVELRVGNDLIYSDTFSITYHPET